MEKLCESLKNRDWKQLSTNKYKCFQYLLKKINDTREYKHAKYVIKNPNTKKVYKIRDH